MASASRWMRPNIRCILMRNARSLSVHAHKDATTLPYIKSCPLFIAPLQFSRRRICDTHRSSRRCESSYSSVQPVEFLSWKDFSSMKWLQHWSNGKTEDALVQLEKDVDEALETYIDSQTYEDFVRYASLLSYLCDAGIGIGRFGAGHAAVSKFLNKNSEFDAVNKSSLSYVQSIFLSRRGEIYDRTDQFENARRDYQQAVKCDPNNFHALKRLGFMLIRMEEMTENQEQKKEMLLHATDHINRAREIMERAEGENADPEIYFASGMIKMRNSSLDDAIEEFHKSAEIARDYAPAYHKLGECYQALGDYPAAIETYNKYYEHFPDYFNLCGDESKKLKSSAVFSDVVFKRGLCHFELEHWELAGVDFDAVIFADACYKDLAHHFRGKCHIKAKEWEGAIERNTDALKINALLVSAFEDRAYAYEQQGMMEEAQKDREMGKKLKESSQADYH